MIRKYFNPEGSTGAASQCGLLYRVCASRSVLRHSLWNPFFGAKLIDELFLTIFIVGKKPVHIRGYPLEFGPEASGELGLFRCVFFSKKGKEKKKKTKKTGRPVQVGSVSIAYITHNTLASKSWPCVRAANFPRICRVVLRIQRELLS